VCRSKYRLFKRKAFSPSPEIVGSEDIVLSDYARPASVGSAELYAGGISILCSGESAMGEQPSTNKVKTYMSVVSSRADCSTGSAGRCPK